MSRWNLVYITSNSHSGSTLLDMLIGSHSSCITLGEIHKLTRKSKGVCACGAPNYQECAFWRDVDVRLQACGGPKLPELHLDSTQKDEFQEMNHYLFRVLQEKTNAQWFVDSSKKLSRLKSLVSDRSFNVVPVHIIRRPEGVVCSNMRKGRGFYGELHSYYYDLWNRYKYLHCRRHVLVSYESLCSQPDLVLGKIMERLGLFFESAQLQWSKHEHHNVNGNKRTRTSRQSLICLDERWRRELKLWQRLVVKLATIKFRLKLLLFLRVWPKPL